MTKEDGYKQTKICKCISCGRDVTVTKFASAAKVLCDECKSSGKTPNPEIISQVAIKKVEIKSKYNGGDTKVCNCIKCGKEVTVTKFASASKVLCDECKDDTTGGYSQQGEINMNPVIHLNKLDRNVVPTLEEYSVTPALFANRALRQVKCPACGHEHMKILKVLDWSIFGLIIHYQCPKCKLLISVSEQSKRMVHYKADSGDMFDYSGEAITTGISALDNSRMSMSIMKLINILKEHNIQIDGDELPPYLYNETRPVPVGYIIPKDDKTIKVIDDIIKTLDGATREGTIMDIPEGNRYIQISDTMAKKLSASLKELLKEDNDG